jgi:clan AA aspartic protease (TIGR02281 family)
MMTPEHQRDDVPFSVSLAPRRKPSAGRRVRSFLGFAGAGVVVLLVLGVFTLFATGSMGDRDWAAPTLGNAQSCVSDGNLKCAEYNYMGYLKKYPSDAQSTARLALILTQDGQHGEALPYYEQALKLGVQTYDLYAGYAISLNNTGRTEAAIKMNYAALKIAPSLVDVRGALADQLLKQGRPKEALALLDDFDQSLADQGAEPYFQSRVEQLRIQLGQAPPAQAATGQTSAGRLEIPLGSDGGTLYVPVRVDGAMTLRFTVDSGASAVSISSDVARSLRRAGLLGPGDYIGRSIMRTADGSLSMCDVVKIRSLQVGDSEIHNVSALITKADSPLLLGQSFLHRYKSWSIDNRRRVLVLER